MKRCMTTLMITLMALLAAGPCGAQTVEFRLDSGGRFRADIGDAITVTYMEYNREQSITGELVKAGDLFIVVRGDVAGRQMEKTLFKSDIASMSHVTAGGTAGTAEESATVGADKRPTDAEGSKEKPRSSRQGVFVLPLKGGVGQTFRDEEIRDLVDYVDKHYGPGQTIVLIIDSNGGLVAESDRINQAIWDAKERHRMVAWVHKATSAGCSTAMACDEIYFMTEGTAGSVTTVMGVIPVEGAAKEEAIRRMEEVCRKGGYSVHIGRAMKASEYMCSYDKDPETGKVTFYGDLSGEYILSDAESNLNFNSSVAEHCGFSKGTADTGEELAALLGLEEWYEVDEYGRTIAERWQTTYERVSEDIQRQLARLSYWKQGGGDPVEVIGAQIKIFEKLLHYARRYPETFFQLHYNADGIERTIEELRKQLADIRRARRGR